MNGRFSHAQEKNNIGTQEVLTSDRSSVRPWGQTPDTLVRVRENVGRGLELDIHEKGREDATSETRLGGEDYFSQGRVGYAKTEGVYIRGPYGSRKA